jgi:Zn-dependent peptidase ImmA (M78 family)/predicted secreted protein
MMPQPWSAIHRIAAAEAMRAHRELGVDTSRPIDPFVALRRSGVLVMRQPLDRLAGAYLPAVATDGGYPGVLINVAHPPSRQRYTAAHELWHHRRDRDIVLDADTEWMARGEDGDSDRERLAEAFASWFLMPKRLVASTLAMLGVSSQLLDEQGVYALSLELGTSYTATVRQLHGLKLITARLRDRLLKATPQSIKRALGEADLTADPWRDVRLIGARTRGRAVGAIEGDIVALELPEIPSSGFLWRPTVVPQRLSFVRDEYRPVSADALGGNGVHRFVFSVRGSGAHRIRLELARPWQSERTVEVRDVEVIAEPKPAAGVVDPLILVGAAA